jgi:hypothetical protein
LFLQGSTIFTISVTPLLLCAFKNIINIPQSIPKLEIKPQDKRCYDLLLVVAAVRELSHATAQSKQNKN